MSDPDGDDSLRKQARLAARAARFNNVLPGNRYKELDAARSKERKAFLEQGLITSGKTQLDAAVDMRGSCEGMCSEYEMEFREFTKEIHPFEATPSRRMDHAKAVAAYTRSDAGAGHGEAAILPSDLRTPAALVRSLDYLINEIMPLQPAPNPNAVNPPPPTDRRALGYTSGYIRDRTRAIRKEFAIQSSWGHAESISCFERIARWHILCLRELQEETGSNTDMHIDSAELGRCFTSLRQQYNDRREELRNDLPCPNEPEFRAYMLIYDLNSKSVSIPISELPSSIVNHPLIQLAFSIRQAAQRNFDSQKEGSKLNAELGANLITRFVRLLKQQKVPYLLSCLVEIRLREMRRSAIRALTRSYPMIKQGQGPIRLGADGEIVERRMILMPMLDRLLGAEEQEDEATAWDDIIPVPKSRDDESVAIVERFGIEVYKDPTGPVGAMINRGSLYNDNKDAPFTRRWKSISQKKGSASYSDIVNGRAGVSVDGGSAAAAVTTTWTPPVKPAPPPQSFKPSIPIQTGPRPPPSAGTFASGGAFSNGSAAAPKTSAFSNGSGVSAFTHAGKTPAVSAFASVKGNAQSAFAPAAPAAEIKPAPAKTPFRPASTPAPSSTTPTAPPPAIPSFFGQKAAVAPQPSAAPTAPPSFFPTVKKPDVPDQGPSKSQQTRPSFFNNVTTAGPSRPTKPLPAASSLTPIPSFFGNLSAPAAPPVSTPAAPPAVTLTGPTPMSSPSVAVAPVKKPLFKPRQQKPEIPKIKIPRDVMRTLPVHLRDQLVQEVVAKLVQDRKPILEKINRQREIAHAYVEERANRTKALHQAASAMLEVYLREHIAAAAKEAFDHEQRVRDIVRHIALGWRAWAAHRVRERQIAEAKREYNFAKLSGKGLAHSVAAYDSRHLSVSRRGSTTSTVGPLAMSRAASALTTTSSVGSSMPEVEVVLELHQAESARIRLFEKATFLHAIARHVAPLIRVPSTEEEPIWETILLTSDHAGTPANEQARQWLTSKFVPDGDTLQFDGADFIASTADVHDDLPGSTDAGLFVLETPLETFNSRLSALNADDANDRLAAASGRLQQGSRYLGALLILTWQEETLDEVVERLQIQEAITEFAHVQVLCIDGINDLDERFTRAVKALVPAGPRKKQVVLPMEHLVMRVEPQWHDFIYLTAHVLGQFSTNPDLINAVAIASIDLLNAVRGCIDDALEELPVSAESTYQATPLPEIRIDATTLAGVVDGLVDYLSEPLFAQVSDIALTIPPLRLAMRDGAPPPILPVLHALAAVVFGQLTLQTLRLDQWLVPPHHAHAIRTLMTAMTEPLGKVFRVATNIVARARSAAAMAEARAKQEAAERLALAARTALPPSPPKAGANGHGHGQKSKGTKRSIDETGSSAASKAAKTARLLRALADANDTLNQLDAGMEVEWQR